MADLPPLSLSPLWLWLPSVPPLHLLRPRSLSSFPFKIPTDQICPPRRCHHCHPCFAYATLAVIIVIITILAFPFLNARLAAVVVVMTTHHSCLSVCQTRSRHCRHPHCHPCICLCHTRCRCCHYCHPCLSIFKGRGALYHRGFRVAVVMVWVPGVESDFVASELRRSQSCRDVPEFYEWSHNFFGAAT